MNIYIWIFIYDITYILFILYYLIWINGWKGIRFDDVIQVWLGSFGIIRNIIQRTLKIITCEPLYIMIYNDM